MSIDYQKYRVWRDARYPAWAGIKIIMVTFFSLPAIGSTMIEMVIGDLGLTPWQVLLFVVGVVAATITLWVKEQTMKRKYQKLLLIQSKLKSYCLTQQ